MKREKEFLREFYLLDDLNYIKFFKNDKILRSSLFREYLKTELKPNFTLYVSQFYSEKEIQNELNLIHSKIPIKKLENVSADFVSQTEFEKKINELRTEFYGLKFKSKLPLEFFSHSIVDTQIYKSLHQVEYRINEFKGRVLNKKKFNTAKYAKSFSNSIINDLDRIRNGKLTELILNNFIDDNENTHIIGALCSNGGVNFVKEYGVSYDIAFSNYTELKTYADNFLRNHLKKSKVYLEKKNWFVLDKTFINDIRLYWGLTINDFGEEIQEIVPEKQEHSYLFSNFNISDLISNFYYLPTSDLMTEKEYQEMVSSGFVGKKETALTPYSLQMFGAYFTRKAMYFRLLGLITYNKDVLLKGNKIRNFDDLIPYFKEYSNGFAKGYSSFDEDCINPFMLGFSDKTDYVQKVFEYLTKNINFEHSWKNNHAGFTISHNFQKNIKEIINAYQDGQRQGYFYKAWSIVLSNHKIFEPLFEKLHQNLKSNQKQNNEFSNSFKLKVALDIIGDNKIEYSSILFHHIKDVLKTYKISNLIARGIMLDMKGAFSPEQNEIIIEPIILYLERSNIENYESNESKRESIITVSEIVKEDILNEHNKLIPKVTIKEVFDHFEILTKTTNKDNVVYLTEKQLLDFIKATFVDAKPIQQNFNCIVHSKKDVRSVFYRFYKKSTLYEVKQTGLKQKYFDIMDKSFSGFNNTDLKEFNKTNNTIET